MCLLLSSRVFSFQSEDCSTTLRSLDFGMKPRSDLARTGNSRPGFFRALRRIVGKKRAASIDDTIASHESSDSINRVQLSKYYLPAERLPNPSTHEGSVMSDRKGDFSFPTQDDAAITVTSATSQTPKSHQNHRPPVINIEFDDGKEDPVYQDVQLRARLEALRAQQMLLGEVHPDVIFSLQGLANVHCRRGEYRQANRVFDEARRRSYSVAEEGSTIGEAHLCYPSTIYVVPYHG